MSASEPAQARISESTWVVTGSAKSVVSSPHIRVEIEHAGQRFMVHVFGFQAEGLSATDSVQDLTILNRYHALVVQDGSGRQI